MGALVVLFMMIGIFGMMYGDELIKLGHRWLDIREKEAEHH